MLARGPSSRCILGRTLLGIVGVGGMSGFLSTIGRPVTGYLVINRPAQLTRLRGRVCRRLGSHVNIFHSRPCFLRLIPGNVSGTRSLTILLGRVKLAHRRVVTVNSKFGSLSVVRCTKLNVTVTGTRRMMGRGTSFVALSGRRSNITCTTRGFVLS